MKIPKKTITYFAFLTLIVTGVVGLTHSASAQTGSSTATTSRDFQRGIQDKRDEFKSQISERRDEFKSNLEAEKEKFKSERMKLVNGAVGNSVDRMVERQNKIVSRLTSIADKIMTRSAKVKVEGKDTAPVEKLVAEGRAQIELAKANILKIPEAVNTGIAITTPQKNRFEALRALAETIRTELKSAHTSLGSAVKLLKALDPKPNASSTSSRSDI